MRTYSKYEMQSIQIAVEKRELEIQQLQKNIEMKKIAKARLQDLLEKATKQHTKNP